MTYVYGTATPQQELYISNWKGCISEIDLILSTWFKVEYGYSRDNFRILKKIK
jgi:hypothetical protein